MTPDDPAPGDAVRSVLGPTGTGPDGTPFTPEEIRRALASRRQRLVLYVLADRGGTVPLAELAERIAAWEQERSPRFVDQETKESVLIHLHHGSVPKLADVGVVTHHVEDAAATLADRAEPIRPALDAVMDREDRDVGAWLDGTWQT